MMSSVSIKLVRTGDALLAPSITRRLVERFAPRGASTAPGRPGSAGAAVGPRRQGLTGYDTSVLTPRELEVLGLIARGMSNAEIAATLTLSDATVKTHVARILTKLGLRDRPPLSASLGDRGSQPGSLLRGEAADRDALAVDLDLDIFHFSFVLAGLDEVGELLRQVDGGTGELDDRQNFGQSDVRPLNLDHERAYPVGITEEGTKLRGDLCRVGS
jgi:DNA-binding CsgD family transcriptional regulator